MALAELRQKIVKSVKVVDVDNRGRITIGSVTRLVYRKSVGAAGVLIPDRSFLPEVQALSKAIPTPEERLPFKVVHL